MAIYTYKPDDAYEFARSQGAKTYQKGDELQFQYCPYCGGGHSKDKRTFAINLKTGAFNCKRGSCGQQGNMIRLAKDFGATFSLGRDVDTYYHTKDYTKSNYRTFKDRHHITPQKQAIEYMASRGIPADVTDAYEITTQKDGKTLVFPFRDEKGELVFVKYRNPTFKKGDKGNKEWCEHDCKPILFGMNHCSGSGTLVITEGQIDSLSLTAAGIPNAVSVPTGKNGFTWVPYCYDFMQKYDKIVVFGDNENGHITLSEEISARWPMKTYIVDPEDYHGHKDANEILQDGGAADLKAAIENAKPISTGRIKRLSKVTQKDIESLAGFRTELPSLDAILGQKIRFGQLIVLTGRRGEGKSTFAGMLMVRALQQKIKTFCYSGELTDFIFRNWLDRQVAGHNIKQSEMIPDENGNRPELANKLDQFYGDKMYLFDNTYVDDSTEETEQASLLKSMEMAIVQYGCQFLVVDNLMSVLTADPSQDIYRAQSEFTGKLVKLTKRYNVAILLIVHPRKTMNDNLENDDVSGSADITNKADIVLTYGKPKKGKGEVPPGPDDRVLRVTKNRLFGTLTDQDGIELHFDAGSKRIAERTAELFKIKILPDEIQENDPESYEQMELPFEPYEGD